MSTGQFIGLACLILLAPHLTVGQSRFLQCVFFAAAVVLALQGGLA